MIDTERRRGENDDLLRVLVICGNCRCSYIGLFSIEVNTMNAPLTEQDFKVYHHGKLLSFDKDMLQRVQSAKRLLKHTLNEWRERCGDKLEAEIIYNCLCEIDACFQIDDGDDKE